ncbi:MAG: hypothetical protein WCE69_09950 [Aestuariivirga sp.]
MKALPKPQYRSPLRKALGKAWFIARRRVQWHLPGRHYATMRSATLLLHEHAIMMYQPLLESPEPQT